MTLSVQSKPKTEAALQGPKVFTTANEWLEKNSATARIEALIGAAAADGVRVVMVSHDLGQVRRLAQRVVMMHKGCVIEDGAVGQILDAPGHADTGRFVRGDLLI